MEPALKKILKSVTLELRHLLEGRYDAAGAWLPGDLEQRLAAIGVRRDRASVPVDELPHLSSEDRQARRVVDAYLKLREDAGVDRTEAVAEFVRETAYTWANRLLALRCMEARELIDPVILQQEAYGGRSLEHHRLAQRHPELCVGEDDGLFAVLDKVFREQLKRLPMLFDPQAPGIAMRPSPSAIKDCFGLLSLEPETLKKYRIRLKDEEVGDVSRDAANPFLAPDALGWAYQYWNTEEKERVFAKVRTVKGAKIARSDIVPATQLYTEDYMVKFLVQNSLGVTWMGMHPESRLTEGWEYYVREADRAPVPNKPVEEISFLDPACGSGHFLLEAFDLFYAMYEEEGRLTDPVQICTAILTKNLFGIDIDARSVQIAEAALWMKAAERAFDFAGGATNLVAATSSHLKGEGWEQFLAGFEREPSVARVLRKFAQSMEHIDEIGSLARPAEELRDITREEHATWERQVRERRETNYLFPEMNQAALQSHLPFHEISDAEFGERLFYRAKSGIDTFTQRARESGEFQDQLLGDETRAGFRLVDLLSRRYDVVAANPPYMGSKNMGPTLKKFVERNFKAGKRDLYASFILRNRELASDGGRVAMVTQQSWMFLRSFADLRAIEPEKLYQLADKSPRGLLRDATIETLAHLGPNAFGEISGEVVNCALFVVSAIEPLVEHRITAFRLIGPKSPEEKDRLLREALESLAQVGQTGEPLHAVVSHPLQRRFLDIPQAPLCYWLRERFFELLAGKTLGNVADVCQGLATANDVRFVRYAWEARPNGWQRAALERRWVPFEKGGGYGKWFGHHFWVVDWEHTGARIKATPQAYVRNADRYFTEGWTYTWIARGSLGLRLMATPAIIAGAASSGIYERERHAGLAGVLNCRFASAMVRSLSAKIQLPESSVVRVPLPEATPSSLTAIESTCLALKRQLVLRDPTELSFARVSLSGPSFTEARWRMMDEVQAIAAMLHTIEGLSERTVFASYNISGDDLQTVLDETGTPAGWFPFLAGYEAIPPLPELGLGIQIPEEILSQLADHAHRNPALYELANLKTRLRTLYEAGPGAKVEEEENDSASLDDEEDSETIAVGARATIPVETFLEELSQKLEVHPISTYWLLKEGIEQDGWRCLSEERRLLANRITVTVLRLLGHRWPKEIEASESVPDWADQDGIIPLTPLVHESTLFERVRERLKDEEVDVGDFADVMGKPLDAWLATEFFKHHTQQFRKRPIAWQIQSSKFTARKAPAFACLLYYHKLDADTLPKLRTQYVGPLRQRLETELRGIQGVAAEARSDRQEKRRLELDDSIRELTEFDAKLEQVSREGFRFTGLAKQLDDEHLDRWCSLDGKRPHPTSQTELITQESAYAPDLNDGVRVNIAPFQRAGLLAADVLSKKDVEKAIADRATWRVEERRWVREGKLPQPGWWPEEYRT